MVTVNSFPFTSSVYSRSYFFNRVTIIIAMMADANNKRTVSYKTDIRTQEGLKKRFQHKGDKHNKFTIFRDETTSALPGFHAGHSSIPVAGIEI